jgi:hypothetical protein
MTPSFKSVWIVALVYAACRSPDPAPPRPGVAQEAWCQGYVVDDVVFGDAVVPSVSPGDLADAADAWGPQLLTLSVDQGFSPQVTYVESPSIALEQDKITKTLQSALSFSLTTSVNLVAETSVAVPTGAYYRVEAYPEYQLVTFDVRVDPCGPTPGSLVTTGSVQKPVGVYFRIMDYVGSAWNALSPPSPADPPPAADAGAGGGDAGAGDAGP